MKNYCINLDRRPDKWAYVRMEFERMGVRVTRFTAINTHPGWVGCRMSHLKLLKMNRREDVFIIYEDDVRFLQPWDMVEKAMSQLPDDWDMLYLGASPKEPQERYSENLFRLKNAHVTHAIIWHNRPNGAIDYILNHEENMGKWDVFLANIIQSNYNCFVTFPMAVTQTQFSSDTCTRSDVSTIVKNYNLHCK